MHRRKTSDLSCTQIFLLPVVMQICRTFAPDWSESFAASLLLTATSVCSLIPSLCTPFGEQHPSSQLMRISPNIVSHGPNIKNSDPVFAPGALLRFEITSRNWDCCRYKTKEYMFGKEIKGELKAASSERRNRLLDQVSDPHLKKATGF